VAYTLSFTTEEWAAVVSALEVPQPLGLDLVLGEPDGETDSAALEYGARSLLGRGMFDPADSDNDVHPLLVRLLLALLEAEEIVLVSTAYPGMTSTYGWYVVGAWGVAMSQDPFTNLRFRVAPAAEVIAQAQQSLASFRPATPAREQYPIDLGDLRPVVAALASAEGPAPVLEAGPATRSISFLSTVRSWTRDGADVEESGVLVVGLDGHGAWVVDDGGGVAVLTQMRSAWPDGLRRFDPDAGGDRPA
jgi:hypothetical protein